MTVPDGVLVERALAGDADAFGTLSERHYPTVWMLAYQRCRSREDAEDLVQEALVRAFKALPTLREPERFAAWLYHITLKLCLDWIRRQGRDPTVRVDDEVLGQSESGRFQRVLPVGAALEAAEEHERLLAELGRLPDKYRLVITLRHLRKMSYKEIAEHLGEPPGTVANRLHRATRMLQERLGEGAASPGSPLEEPR